MCLDNILKFIVQDENSVPQKLSHKQKQRAAKRAKKKAELVEKRKALKQAKKNVAKQTEVKLSNKVESNSGEEKVKGNLAKLYINSK